MQRPFCIYLDHNATTPCAPEVLEAMLPFFSERFGNAGSPHLLGRAAATAIATAREEVAALVGCRSGQIVFTSGATESNNLAILGLASSKPLRRKIVVSAVEHKSVLAPCDYLEQQGFEVTRLPVDRDARVDLVAAAETIDDQTLLVSVQGANNEVGTIQPIAEIAEMAAEHGAIMHSDGAQLLGKVTVDVAALPVQLASFSAHKVYGPKGIGALYISDASVRALLTPLQFGGGQEDGLRPGTANTAAVAGFGVACSLARGVLPSEPQRLAKLRDHLESMLCDRLAGTVVNARQAQRLATTSSITLRGVPSDVLIANALSVCISDVSACSSGAPSPSHVLLAMGLDATQAEATIRVGLGRYTNQQDIGLAAAALVEAALQVLTTGED